MKVKVKKLTETARLPQYAHEGDIGADVFSDTTVSIHPRSRAVVKTGISLEIDPTFFGYARVAPRSGLASKGIDVSAGVVDKSYRGEIGVVLVNNTDRPFQVNPGDKIAQLIFEVAATAQFEQVGDLEATSRGDSGFGSTGF